MSWVSLAHMHMTPLTPYQLSGPRPLATRLPPHLVTARTPHTPASLAHAEGAAGGSGGPASGLGAARAGSTWRWASSATAADVPDARRVTRLPAPEYAPIAIPADVLRAMREAARVAGRRESDVWAEAAREWLRQRRHDDGPLPPAPAAALAVPFRARSWSAVDAALADLRQPQRLPAPGQPAA